MSGDALRAHAKDFLMVATRHPACRAGRIAEVAEARAVVELDIDVEMPLHQKVDGVSANGVRRVETAQTVLSSSYPWSSPTFFLRSDFPRDLPHLQPGPASAPPRPCLVAASEREYFLQFGLVEAGVLHLIHQLALWLQRAAEGALISAEQGWEPTLRRALADLLVIDAERCRAAVGRDGGHRIVKARYYRSGPADARLSGEAAATVAAMDAPTPLKRDDTALFTFQEAERGTVGDTVCCVVWPDKLPDGAPFVADSYMPETVTTLAELLRRAEELRCGRPLRTCFTGLERWFRGRALSTPIPIVVVLCARRPFPLIGSRSDIELLPYVLDLRAHGDRTSLFAAGDAEPVAPAMQLDATNPALLRTVSGAPAVGPVAILGCGSVGSKMAMHLARSGIDIPVLSDRGILLPHNMARHALARPPLPAASKAIELADELARLGQSPGVHQGDLVTDLMTSEGRRTVLLKAAAFALNTTASLGVREALSSLPPDAVKPRLAEAALFGRGEGGFLLVEGEAHNPTVCDLVAELCATARSERLRSLLFDPEFGLTEIQIGQGCGSLTMPMTDMRLSAMTAGLTEALLETMQAGGVDGQIVVGTTADGSRDTRWSLQTVAPFTTIDVEPGRDWSLRLSRRVLEQIRAEMRRYPTVETGGVLIGTCSVRLRAITIVDLLAAPPDSVRSSAHFTLGTQGLKAAVRARHRASGGTLYDVGTWHSHLADQGPSPLDRQTARELAAERPPPSVLLIATPQRLHALMHARAGA